MFTVFNAEHLSTHEITFEKQKKKKRFIIRSKKHAVYNAAAAF